jgi:acyl-CoA reductase-like NAD-dependent aldehyde dehydrogenase
MTTVAENSAIKTITAHYIDGAFVESQRDASDHLAVGRTDDVDDFLAITGSVAVGERIMRDGAGTMKRVTLELGGKSPTIMLARASRGFTNTRGARRDQRHDG